MEDGISGLETQSLLPEELRAQAQVCEYFWGRTCPSHPQIWFLHQNPESLVFPRVWFYRRTSTSRRALELLGTLRQLVFWATEEKG